MDWKDIQDDREKYQAYLCSREWAEKREAVRERAGEKCERCKILPIDAVHHLTYARKYDEPLNDLQAICRPCHEFTHGKSNLDPMSSFYTIRFLMECRNSGKEPMPFDLYVGICGPEDLEVEFAQIVRVAMILYAAGLGLASGRILRILPFHVPESWLRNQLEDIPTILEWWKWFRFTDVTNPKWINPDYNEE